MAYSDAAAVLRADINVLVEEAASAEQLFIGPKVFPPWSVDEQNGQWPRFRLGKGELLNDDVTLRTPGGTYGRVSRAYETDTFDCEDRGIEEVVDDVYRKNVARFFSAETAAARQCLRQVMLGHEIRVAAELINTGNFTNTDGSADYTAANIATVDFPGDVLSAINRLNLKGVLPNAIVLSGTVANYVKKSTKFQNFVRGNLPSGQPVQLTEGDFVRAFADMGINQVHIGKLGKNSNKKGLAFSGASIWPNTHIWVGRIEGGDPLNGGAGRTAVWNAEGGIWVTETYREEARRSDIVRVRQNTDEKVVDTTAGELIQTDFA